LDCLVKAGTKTQKGHLFEDLQLTSCRESEAFNTHLHAETCHPEQLPSS